MGSLTCGIDKVTLAGTPFSAHQNFGAFQFTGLDVSPHLVKLGLGDLSRFRVNRGANPSRAFTYDWSIGDSLIETVSYRC